MKKLYRFIFISCLIFCTMLCSVFGTNFYNSENSKNKSYAASSVKKSLFIHSPTFSTLVTQIDDDGKSINRLYFIDEYDNILKVYNTSTQKFESYSLSLASFGLVVDVTCFDNKFFIITNTDSSANLVVINLDSTLSATTIDNLELSKEYTKISVNNSSYNTQKTYTISLSPTFISEDNNLKTVLLNKNDLSLICVCNLKTDNPDFFDLENQNYAKLLTIPNPTNYNYVYLLCVFNSKIYFSSTSTSSLASTNQSPSWTPLNDKISLASSQSYISILNVNLCYIDSEPYFLVSYLSEIDKTITPYSLLYHFIIDVLDSPNTTFTEIDDNIISTPNTKNILTTNDYVIYSNNQNIYYTKITETGALLNSICNVQVEESYKPEPEFIYATTTSKTNLLEEPWSAKETIVIPEATDIVIIGNGIIYGETIEDYVYCLYTKNGINYKGYVYIEDISNKAQIALNDYEYQIFNVVPNTKLYTLPTKVINNKITSELESKVIMQIPENSNVEVIDAICKYKSDGNIMLKVKVNDNQIGFIEYNAIIPPSAFADFVITNAYIKANNTKVYLNSTASSPVIGVLEKDYRVRVNGSRDTKTGFTSITYNDEYGNERTGYIQTDVVSTDSWTTLQLIGCILIAINIGLLILILRFKKQKIGSDGNKYETERDSSLKKS